MKNSSLQIAIKLSLSSFIALGAFWACTKNTDVAGVTTTGLEGDITGSISFENKEGVAVRTKGAAVVYLQDSIKSTIDSTYTDSTGSYVFLKKPFSTYKITAKTQGSDSTYVIGSVALAAPKDTAAPIKAKTAVYIDNASNKTHVEAFTYLGRLWTIHSGTPVYLDATPQVVAADEAANPLWGSYFYLSIDVNGRVFVELKPLVSMYFQKNFESIGKLLFTPKPFGNPVLDTLSPKFGNYLSLDGNSYLELDTNILNNKCNATFSVDFSDANIADGLSHTVVASGDSRTGYTPFKFSLLNGKIEYIGFKDTKTNKLIALSQTDSSGTIPGITFISSSMQTLNASPAWNNIAVTLANDGTKTFLNLSMNGLALKRDTLAGVVCPTYDKAMPMHVGALNGTNKFKGKVDQILIIDTTATEAQISKWVNYPGTL